MTVNHLFLVFLFIVNITHHAAVRVGGNKINNLTYAESTVFIADSVEKLQNVLTTVTIESKNKELQLNAKKTERMIISKQSRHSLQRGKNKTSTEVDNFKYTGFTITPDARWDKEIKKRTALSKDSLIMMKSISTNRNIRIHTKINTDESLQMVHLSAWM